MNEKKKFEEAAAPEITDKTETLPEEQGEAESLTAGNPEIDISQTENKN